MTLSLSSREQTRGGRFASTHWSVVLTAAQSRAPEAEAALEALCLQYWYPLYGFLRRKGLPREEAQDLTQEFFASRVMTRLIFRGADQGRGKFRSWLLNSLNHFFCNEWNRQHALKRGGAHSHVPLDFTTGEESYVHEPSHAETPEKLFDRAWALTTLENTLQRLRVKYAEEGQAAVFEALCRYLPGALNPIPYCETAARLGKSEDATKMAVSRLKHEYGRLLRQEIKRTVSSQAEADQEFKELLAILAE
jgi:RNA polymerase sigma-70 factor (ECF subfamily)